MLTSATVKCFSFIRSVAKCAFTISFWLLMCRFHFFAREGSVITHPFKYLQGSLQGWKHSLGLWIQEKLHQQYTGMFTELLRTLQRAEELEVGVSRTVRPTSLYPFSPKVHKEFCAAALFTSKSILVSAGLQTQFT